MEYLIFPILFMLHDFEEIIWGHPWLKRNVSSLQVPKFIKRMVVAVANLSSKQFTLIVLEEFICCILISLCAFWGRGKWLFLGIMIGYILHCIMHVVQCIYIKRYIPLVISAVITGIVVGILIFKLFRGVTFVKMIIDGLIGTFLIITNILFAFWCSKFF